MARPTFSISIPQPCHENWDAMTPTRTGRHCAACDKVVTDFTRMTDGELVAWLQRHQGQAVCGRIPAHQLNRPLLPAAEPAARWHRWALAALALVGVTMPAVAQNKKAASQTERLHREPKWPAEPLPEKKIEPPVALPQAEIPKPTVSPVDTGQVTLYGTVLDHATREPIPGVDVVLKDRAGCLAGHATTNAQGRYELRPVSSQSIAGGQLAFINISFEKQLVPIPPGAGKVEVNARMSEQMVMLGGSVVMVAYERYSLPRRIWGRTKAIVTWPFRRHQTETE